MTINTFPIQTIDAATIVTQIETAKTDTQAARDAALQALADAEQIVEDLTSEPFEISDTAGLQAALDAKASASALALAFASSAACSPAVSLISNGSDVRSSTICSASASACNAASRAACVSVLAVSIWVTIVAASMV